MIKKSVYVGAVLLFLFSVISCEKDFTDIGNSVVNNGVFETKDTLLEISIYPKDITSVRADGGISIAGLGEYLLGVYTSDDFRTIEASIVSQVGYQSGLTVVDDTYESDTTVVTTMDKVFIKIPYQSTALDDYDDGKPQFRIDSILGDPTVAVAVSVYQNKTYLNTLDPDNPTQQNEYQSDAGYTKGDLLNESADFTFTVPQNSSTQDTVYYFNRNLSNGNTIADTLKITSSAPFFTIPLDKSKIKELFLDKYEDAEFDNADAFNNHFRGLIIEATGTDGSLIPFNFTTGAPTLEINYTNTVWASGAVIDTLSKTDSFTLSGVRNSIYKPSGGNTPDAGNFVIQGATGTMANIGILEDSQLEDLKAKNWLINDASLVFYINKEVGRDTTYVPQQLFLFKNDTINNTKSQISDVYTEGTSTFGGFLLDDDDSKVDRYHFRITDHVSDLLSGETTYNPPLGLRVYNSNDAVSTDTIVGTYNWNPRGIILHSNTSSDSERKAQLKISYSVKK